MALAQVKTQNPGNTILSGDWNSEFQNILNNPITLISPTTGPINFNLQAHTNFVVQAVSVDPTSTVAGRIMFNSTRNQLQVDDGTVIRAVPSLVATGLVTGLIPVVSSSNSMQFVTIPMGTSGQILTVTSSTLTPTFSAFTKLADQTTVTSGELLAGRFGSKTVGTTLTGTNFSISSGWGSTAVLQSISGTDQAYTFTILTGSTMVANPTVTTTFADGNWPSAPLGMIQLTGGSGAGTALGINNTPTSSGQAFQMFFTPSTGKTYTFMVINFG